MSPVSRREFVGGALSAALLTQASFGAPRHRPDIIVIVMDDQRFDALSCFEGKSALNFIRTPNMDRLANEGVRFRNDFVTFSLCSPSRATMLSGKNVRTHGVNRLAANLPEGCRIFPSLLKEAGCETGFVGKWHLGVDSDRPNAAFDYWAGVRGQGEYIDPVINVNGKPTKTSGYATDIFTDHCLDSISRRRHKRAARG